MLEQRDIDFFNREGYLHVPALFNEEEMDSLDRDLAAIVEHWATVDPGWSGPWRKAYMDEETERQSKLMSMHDLHFYSAQWLHAVTHPRLVEVLGGLLGDNVELHHTTLHAKPPQTGHPFPLHQDNAFYEHTNDRYVDVLVHLDDTCHENGEIRFMARSHHLGYLPHITETQEGPCTPHLPVDQYPLADTVPVPARRGDVVCFNILTLHGSHINRTDRIRRMVRCGYRDPSNTQVSGQSLGRPGIMVRGTRARI